ncbi:MAG: TSUP family transporter [Gammaproteobacteria bacterium]|nr:TSUP family transporter [Gammaproteobacteria bacterium]
MEITYLLFILLGFGSALVSAVFGFGTALILLSLGSYLLPIKETIALATVLFIASTVTKTVVFGKHIDWKLVGIMSVISVPFAYIGAELLYDLPGELLKRCLGGTILVYLLLERYQWFPRVKVGTTGIVLGSAAYGFMSGLLGSGNIVKVMIFREMKISKESFIGAMAATSVLTNVAKLNSYSTTDLLDVTQIWAMVGLVFSAVSAVFIGRLFLRKITVSQFQNGLQLVLFASAAGLLL